MPNNLKALLVVLVMAVAMFQFARPLALAVGSRRDFDRRCCIWLGLTAVAFLVPSFWLFVLVAAPLLFWAARHDDNPFALYLFMLHVIPPVQVNVPIVGINKLFAMDVYRLLDLCVLLPFALKLWREKGRQAAPIRWMDFFVLGYGLLQILLFVRPDTADAATMHDSVTNMLRRAFLYAIDVGVVYYVASRFCRTRERLVEAMAAFAIATLVMAPVAVFETARHWLLYKEMGTTWGSFLNSGYLLRGGVVRAMASSGDSLALGYLLAIAFGFWLYLGRRVGAVLRMGGIAALLLGLIAAYSRGPWLGAVIIYFVYMLLGPRAVARAFKATLIAGVAAVALLMSPLGPRIEKVVPFLGGQVDNFNILYREVLAERSLDMIRLHPYLGDQDAYAKLQDLRQGVGVIDFVNTYADVAVFYGLIGLGLFVGLPLSGMFKDFRVVRKTRRSEPDLSLLGASLSACMVGTLVMIYTSSFIFGYAVLFYVLAGLGASYASIGYVYQRGRSRASAVQPERAAQARPQALAALARMGGSVGGAGRSGARAFRFR
ncbi:MAG TPA: O-antigen ligase family protein [Ktedonobacterales bacterium]